MPEERLDDYTQILLSDDRHREKARGYLKVYPNAWRVNDVRTRNAFLIAGFGWARTARHQVEEELRAEKLVTVLQDQWPQGLLRPALVAIHRRSVPVGPAMSWWLQELENCREEIW